MASLELLHACVRSKNNRVLLDSIDCRFQGGEFTVLTGQNSSGKSLMLQALAGLLPLSAGKLMWGSRKIHEPGNFPRNSLMIIPQDITGFFLSATVSGEISLGLSRSNLGSAEYERRIEEALEWSELRSRADDLPQDLSLSEQRLLAIASAIALGPQFLLLDDPLSAMDRNGASRIIKKLVELARSGTGIIVSCYDLERILAQADRLILLKQGRIIVDALPARVLPYLETHGVRKPNLKLEEMSWLQ